MTLAVGWLPGYSRDPAAAYAHTLVTAAVARSRYPWAPITVEPPSASHPARRALQAPTARRNPGGT
eukprot:15464462-Alexandrium_andersonii.AAC.1